jgi:copper transport protein
LTLARLALLVVAGGMLMVRLFDAPADDEPRPPSNLWMFSAFATLVAVLATFSLDGHASQGGGPFLSTLGDMAHVGAACLWIGGLAVLIVAAVDRENPLPGQTLLRFSRWAMFSAITVAATGLFAAWRQVGSLAALTGTDYGRLVLAKVAAFVLLVSVGALSRRVLHGRLALRPAVAMGAASTARQHRDPDPSDGPATSDGSVLGPSRYGAISGGTRAALRRTVGVELAVAAGILVLTAVLVNARPARQAYVPSVSRTTVAGPTKVVISIPSAKAGPIDLRLQIDDRSTGLADAVPEVDATLSLLGSAYGAVDDLGVELRNAGAGSYVATGLTVPIAGQWRLDVTVRTDEIDEFYANPVTIAFR